MKKRKYFDENDNEELFFFQGELFSSLNIEPNKMDFVSVKTFGDFVNVIVEMVPGKDKEFCISQLTFYKLRDELSELTNVDKNTIILDTSLDTFIPLTKRRLISQILNKKLNTNLKILTPPIWIKLLFGIAIIVSLIVTFGFNFSYGILLTLISITAIYLFNKFAFAFRDDTMRVLVKRVSRYNYNAFKPIEIKNKREISNLIYTWATDYLGWEKGELNENILFAK